MKGIVDVIQNDRPLTVRSTDRPVTCRLQKKKIEEKL